MIAPYYADDTVSLYLGDCREVLPELPRASVDLIVTDPPYGMNWQSGFRTTRLERIAGDDGSLDVEHCLELALRTLRNYRHIYVFGPAVLASCPTISATAPLVWAKGKMGLGDLSLPWGPAHEPITFGVHVTAPSDRAKGRGRLSARLRRDSVITVRRADGGELVDGKDAHQTPKPVLLLRQLIESSSCWGETVLDPFAGYGPTLTAARLEGRKAIGIEKDEATAEKAAKRLADGAS